MVEVQSDSKACCSSLLQGKNEILKEIVRLLLNNETTRTIHNLDQVIFELDFIYDQYMEILEHNVEPSMVRQLTDQLTIKKCEYQLSYAQILEFINIARNSTIDYLYSSSLCPEDKIDGIKTINHVYFLISNYTYEYLTAEKNKELSEKSRFIERMNHDRLTILGKLSTSFAHEFRNPLTSIKGFVQLLEGKNIIDEESKQYINIIKGEISLLEENVSQFLMLSTVKNHEDYDESIFCLVKLIEEVLGSHYPAFVDKNIRLKKSLEKRLVIKAVYQQIKQVLIHIINNALDALQNELKQRVVLVQGYVENDYACISVKNNGPKIPDHLVENIFAPFISTKELASGLGLSVCKQIVEKHQGELICHSTSEMTSFTLKLRLMGQEDIGTH